MATPGSRRAQTRSGLAICEPAIPELRAHVLRSGLPPTSTATLSATGPWMTLRSVNNPAAGDGPALFRNDPPRSGGSGEKLSKLQLGKQNSESVSLLVELARAENPPGSVSRGGRFINEDADWKRL